MQVTLPWPNKVLSPNHMAHFRVKAKARANQKRDAALLCSNRKCPPAEAYALELTFCPPDNRRRDLDNLFASMKGAIDGMCAALKIDDSQFKCVILAFGEKTRNGEVKIKIRKKEMQPLTRIIFMLF